MAYVPVDVPAFGGLDLRDPEDASGSPDLLNVFERRAGVLSTRCGLSSVGSTNLGSEPTGLTAYSTSGLACGFGTTVRTFTTAGVTTASTTGLAGGPWSSVAIGGYAYFANGTDYVLKTGASHTSGAAIASTKASGATSFTGSRKMPKPSFVGRQPVDNRLVAAGFAVANGGPNALGSVTLGDGSTVAIDESMVFFSQPDNPLYWDETDWVTLDYGDGERITAVESWNNRLYVFKLSKFFVFYGNSTDADGGTVFNFRKVDCPGTVRSTVAHRTGVYILTNDGIFVTTGDTPVRVSSPVDCLLTSGTLTTDSTGASFSFGSLVFFGMSSGYWLVFDTETGKWWKWLYGTLSAGFLTTGVELGGYVYCPKDDHAGLYKFDPFDSTSTDAGTAFTGYYTSPYSAWGSPGVEKTVRQTELHGTGTVDLSWGKDLQSHGYAKSVTMLNGRGLDRTAVRGESLSWKVSGSGWTLNRVVPFLREQRASGVKT